MIQPQKMFALPDEIDKERYWYLSDGSIRITPSPERDSSSGAKRLASEMASWTIQPWAARDLDESLEL